MNTSEILQLETGISYTDTKQQSGAVIPVPSELVSPYFRKGLASSSRRRKIFPYFPCLDQKQRVNHCESLRFRPSFLFLVFILLFPNQGITEALMEPLCWVRYSLTCEESAPSLLKPPAGALTPI